MNPIVVKLGKKAKAAAKRLLGGSVKHTVSYVRRIERVRTAERVCAMTFDDGPMALPATPPDPNGRLATEMLLDALKKYNAHATFDIIGSTAENYPDEAGSVGTPEWGGKRYDHYPDIRKDDKGGAVACEWLVQRMLDEGHELANHGYRHVLFGRKPFVYGAREYLKSIDEVTADLDRLHSFIRQKFGYEMRFSRPPHYVDRIDKQFTSYDAYALMRYGYMAASYDGGGWLPSDAQGEIREMQDRIRTKLAENPDFFCGQIIFGKDGYNMAKRTPAAHALESQLSMLYAAGYRVVSVGELMEYSPFADVGRECDIFDKLCALEKFRAIAYSDNTLRLRQTMTNYELAMLLAPRAEVVDRRIARIKHTNKLQTEYDAALCWCKEHGLLPARARGAAAVTALPERYFDRPASFSRHDVYAAARVEALHETETL